MPSNYGIDQAKLETVLSPQRLIQLTTEDPGAVDPDDTVIEEIVLDAEGEFESYASVFYALPVRLAEAATTPPPVVVKMLLYAVAYSLITRRPELLDGDGGESSFWRAKWKEIREWYERIAGLKGPRLYIVGAEEKAASELEASFGGAEAVCPAPGRFTRERMGDL